MSFRQLLKIGACTGLILSSSFSAGFALAQQDKSIVTADAAPTLQAKSWQSKCSPEWCLSERLFLIRQSDQSQRILTLRLSKSKIADRKTQLGLLGPLGVQIRAGVKVEGMGSDAVTLPYVVCAGVGCSAEMDLTEQSMKFLLNENPLIVTFQLSNGNQMVVRADLAGLKSTVDAWTP